MDLVWIVDENVKRAHYKMGRLLKVFFGSDERVRSALLKTEVRKLESLVVEMVPLFNESVFWEDPMADKVGDSHQQAKKVDWDQA